MKSFLLNLLRENKYDKQTQILKALKSKGIHLDQSSLSRNLKKLGIKKENGYYKASETSFLKNKLIHLSIAHGSSMIILHSAPGCASLLAYRLDKLLEHKNSNPKIEGILGTLAGDDTIFVVIRQGCSLEKSLEKIQTYLENEV